MAARPRYSRVPRYREYETVRVRNPSGLRVFFISRKHRACIGRIGTIVEVERGASGKDLYGVVFETAQGTVTLALLESDLEAAE